jgi:hypothetical protein
MAEIVGYPTNWGAIPNMRAEMSRDITPKKNDIFSRVRTTLAECHDAAKLVMREETYGAFRKTFRNILNGTDFQLEVFVLAVEILRKQVAREIAYFECLLSFQLQPITVLLQSPLEEIDVGIKIGFHSV